MLELLALAVAGGGQADVAGEAYFDAARETGRRRAEQGIALDDVLRSFRLGGRLIWEDLVEEAHSREALDADGLREVGTRLWEVVDQTSAQVASSYHAAERELVREDEQRRATLWEGMLHGRAKDAAFALEAARILDLPVRGRYIVVALDRRDGKGTAMPDLEQSLARNGVPSSWQRRTDGVIGVLSLGDSDPARVLDVLGRRAAGPVGVSVVAEALADMEAAHRQALLALRTMAPGERSVVTFDERLSEVLLLTSPDVVERLVLVWLGPLLDLPKPERDPLLSTLETWVAVAGSTTRAAALAHCHRNTVVNRLRRVGTLIGRELVDGSPPVDLVLALKAHRLGLDR